MLVEQEKWNDSLGNGQLAYIVVDGFFDKGREHKMKSILALLNKCDEINIGIPTIDDGTIFSRVPWEWGFVSMPLLQEKTKRSWFFFNTKRKPHLELLVYGGSQLIWSNKTNNTHCYGADELSSSDEDCVEAMKKGWTLHEHIHFTREKSLFCITYSSETPSALSETKKGKSDSVKVAPQEWKIKF